MLFEKEMVEEKKEMIKGLLERDDIGFRESENQWFYDSMAGECGPVTYQFGKYNGEQIEYLCHINPDPHCFQGIRFPMVIKFYWGNNAMSLGTEFVSLLKAWSDINNEGYLPERNCVRNAEIKFGFRNKVYRLKSSAIGMDDGVMEKYAPYILESLRLSGVNYAEYIGFLD